jgi:hypothetical protein
VQREFSYLQASALPYPVIRVMNADYEIWISFFCNQLDRSNINNAYVSGMKEDLNMHGN